MGLKSRYHTSKTKKVGRSFRSRKAQIRTTFRKVKRRTTTRKAKRRTSRKVLRFYGGEGEPIVAPLPYTTETTGASPRIAAYQQAQQADNNQNTRNNMFKGGKGRRSRHIKGGDSGKMTVPQFGQANPESNQASVLLNQSKVNAANDAKYDSAAYVK